MQVTSIEAFLHSLPGKAKVTHVAMDMWRPYRIAVSKVLPEAKIVVDKFHVVSKANAAFEAVRRNLAKTDRKHALGLKRSHKLFAKRHADQVSPVPNGFGLAQQFSIAG